MITFSSLGNHGRLGNQMFQYALLKSVSNKNNFIFAIPKKNHQLFECFDLKCKVYDLDKNNELIKKMKIFQELNFDFDSSVYSCGDNVNYYGNFQTEKYFLNIREELLKDFSFKKEIYNESNEYIKNLKKHNKPIVSIHVRRGDYVNIQNYHPLCTLEYYKKSLENFKDCIILCLSDDIDWCRQNLNFIKDINFSNFENPYIDLCLMTLCDHNIIANSSFSWWGAWLNKNNEKIVFAPKNWFGPMYEQHNIKDLIPEKWQRI
jgi:hypothetical protein